MEYVFLGTGLVLGLLIGWFYAKSKITLHASDGMSRESYDIAIQEQVRLDERVKNLSVEIDIARAELRDEREKSLELSKALESSRAHFKNQQERLEHQQQEIAQLQEKFQQDFEVIASRVLRQNTEQISRINNEKLSDTLKPLGERIKSFEEKMERSGLERAGLKQHLQHLLDLNKQLAEEAHNLTRALKGDSKQQGNWGEVILERVLESSGLVKGDEYITEVASQTSEGQRIRPDAVILLPENKHIIIDAKVTLTAYEKWASCDEGSERDNFLKQHILSVRNHIKILSAKEYYSSTKFNTPDFVLLFMPIESAFSAAMQADGNLFSVAWDSKIVIVSPSTLLATLRTVASIWKQEKQTKNAIKIAEESGKLYDKFVGFIQDMEAIGKHLGHSQRAYDDAFGKLTTGSGNLVRKAENIKALGAKASKSIDGSLLE